MTKAWICILTGDHQTHAAIVDLDNLPLGVNADSVTPFKALGIAIGTYLHTDITRASALVNEIASGKYTDESKWLISNIASFAENAPPADQEKDLLIAVTVEKADILRTSPQVAEKVWRGLKSASSKI